jgi:hypothetical protein
MTTPSRHYLDRPTLSAIEQTKRKVWTSLEASSPTRDWLKDGELRTVAAGRLLDLAEAGVTDADELTRRVRETLSLYLTARRRPN